ncbi:MAG: gamma-glutamyl-gamma-aminobutyrate hydrolase family protein, partial [Chloroflexi bacterium]|nr:gamma-glutamyl-gamma-aminobutyrate hydrolase family protein [Chloroflexota bacterium]
MDDSHRINAPGDAEVSAYLKIAEENRGAQSVPKHSEQLKSKKETIVVIDFGSQYSMLIARRVREFNVYCELVSYDAPWDEISKLQPMGFILSGGPSSVYDEEAPLAPYWVYESHLPILGICYGMQVLCQQLGGKVTPGLKREYGHAILHRSTVDSPLFSDLPQEMPVWMSHGDHIDEM